MCTYRGGESRVTILFILIAAIFLSFGTGTCFAQKVYTLNGSGGIAVNSATDGALLSGTFIGALTESPQFLAISGSSLYVANGKDHSVGLYNAITGATIKAGLVTLPKDPYYLAVEGTKLYILYTGIYGESTIEVVNATTGAVITAKIVPKLEEAGPMVVSGNSLYVIDESSEVDVFNATSGAETNTPLIGNLDDAEAMAIYNGRLYIVRYATGTITVYNATTGEVITSNFIPSLTNISTIAISGSSLYVGSLGNNTLGVYDAMTGAAINTSLFTSLHSNALAVSIAPPMISSTLAATGTVGILFGYRIVAADNPASFNAAGLPGGLTINQTTGLISGKPTATGTYQSTISATNGGGSDIEPLTLVIVPAPPAITSALISIATVGQPFSYQITAKNNPTSFNATGLPNGLSVDTSSGLISGTATTGGIYPVSISATSFAGTGTETLKLTVNYTKVAGTYKGLVAVGGTDLGMFQLTLTPTGLFTGKVTIPGKTYAVKGTFSSSGTCGATITIGTTKLDLDLAIDPAIPDVTGSIAAITPTGTANYLVSGNFPEVFKAGSPPPSASGTYTVMIPAVSGTGTTTPNLPGYGTMTVSSKGAITLSGKLSDGTAVVVHSQLNNDGQTWTLFELLYPGKAPGCIAGTMTFESGINSDCDGPLEWDKPLEATAKSYPGPFSINADFLAARYSAPPLTSSTASLVLSGGNLVNSSTDALTISLTNKVTVTGTDSLVLTLTPKTGAFTGHFLYPGTKKTTAISGVIYQKPTPEGLGLFPDGDTFGQVQISQ
jgi:hypothetical protein